VFKVCKKVKKSECISYYRDYKYTTGQAYKETLGLPIYEYGYYYIGNGLHSYNKQDVKVYTDSYGEIKFHKVKDLNGKTLAGLGDKDGIVLEYKLIILNCIIPQGASYYLNEHGEYVSSELITVSIEEIP
jgi:hypothetical protein